MPRTETIAAPAMKNSPLLGRSAPYAAPATPAPSSTAPTTGERSPGARSPRRPARTATTSCRDAIHAGTTAASRALSSPKAAIPARCGHGTSNGPNQLPEKRWTTGISAQPRSDPEHARPAARPRPRAPRRRPARRGAPATGVPPVAAISASDRDWRRAPTANAGPASSTTSSSAITMTSTATAIAASSVPDDQDRISAGISESGGGSSSTARESTRPPTRLSLLHLFPRDRAAADQPGRRPAVVGRGQLLGGADEDRGVAVLRGLADPHHRQRHATVELEPVADREAPVGERGVDHDLVVGLRDPTLLDVEEAVGERVREVQLQGPPRSRRRGRSRPGRRRGSTRRRARRARARGVRRPDPRPPPRRGPRRRRSRRRRGRRTEAPWSIPGWKDTRASAAPRRRSRPSAPDTLRGLQDHVGRGHRPAPAARS